MAGRSSAEVNYRPCVPLRLKRRRQAGYVGPAAFVHAYLGLGEYDEVFGWFEQAFQEQSTMLQSLKVLPLYDPLREDPRFKDLLRRVGLN